MKNMNLIRRAAIALAAMMLLGLLGGCAYHTQGDPKISVTDASENSFVQEIVSAVDASTNESARETETEPAIADKPVVSAFDYDELVRQAREAMNAKMNHTDSATETSGDDDASKETAEPEIGSVEAISAIIGLQAKVETKYRNCVVYVDDEHNPYDLTWDFGRKYQAYVDAVDWDLVFDAEYYKSVFPMLALQYHDDDELLLEHFQTRGVHEGRQGSEAFNVAAYMDNVGPEVRKALGDDYAAYYFFFMLNQESESAVQHTGDYAKQLAVRMTAFEQREFEHANQYRADVGVAPLVYDSELAAFAAYRAYTDADEHWKAHDWVLSNKGAYHDVIATVGASTMSENTIKSSKRGLNINEQPYESYYNSQPHREAMLNANNAYFGTANIYYTSNTNDGEYYGAVYFDIFANQLSTALNP